MINCNCPKKDAWRCAETRNLSGAITCSCYCHRSEPYTYGWRNPRKPRYRWNGYFWQLHTTSVEEQYLWWNCPTWLPSKGWVV